MKVLVCGDRYYEDHEYLFSKLDELHKASPISTLIHGGARGADTLAGRWGEERSLEVIEVRADWAKYGRGAGHVRNKAMLDLDPSIVIGFHDSIETSKGTKNCLKQAASRSISTLIYKR